MKLLSLILAIAVAATTVVAFAREDEHFKIKEYSEFHDILHKLQHESLPKNDLATIRAMAPEMLKRGAKIVKLGIPNGIRADNHEKFKVELKKFDEALEKYGSEAKSGSDENLKTSYIAVHDSFEELAAMLP